MADLSNAIVDSLSEENNVDPLKSEIEANRPADESEPQGNVPTDENAPADMNDELPEEERRLYDFSDEGLSAGRESDTLAARLSAFRAGVMWGHLFLDDSEDPNLDGAFSMYLLSELMQVTGLDLDLG